MINKKLFMSIILFLSTTNLFSYTQCVVSIERIWTGDNGWVWLHYTNGGSSRIHNSNDDQKNKGFFYK